jgi:1-acyl-sn-glycerol-3-phosphate acyltransferase
MSEQNQEIPSLEWEYAPPPTPYDLVRDSIPIRVGRLIVHFIIRLVIRFYNKLQVTGRENVINNWPCIITPNHTSHLDSVVVFSALPLSYINDIFTLAAKDYFFNNAAITFIARIVANAIPIDRTGAEIRGLRLCLLKQRLGKSILVFPEGTRKSGNKRGKFNKGAIILSKKSRIPIIPAFIRGTSDILPKGRVFPRRHKCAVIFGAPVSYSEDIWSNLEDIAIIEDLENRVRSLSQKMETLENQK